MTRVVEYFLALLATGEEGGEGESQRSITSVVVPSRGGVGFGCAGRLAKTAGGCGMVFFPFFPSANLAAFSARTWAI